MRRCRRIRCFGTPRPCHARATTTRAHRHAKQADLHLGARCVGERWRADNAEVRRCHRTEWWRARSCDRTSGWRATCQAKFLPRGGVLRAVDRAWSTLRATILRPIWVESSRCQSAACDRPRKSGKTTRSPRQTGSGRSSKDEHEVHCRNSLSTMALTFAINSAGSFAFPQAACARVSR